MVVEITVLLAATILGIIASVRVWRIRRTPQRIDTHPTVGMIPGPTDAGASF